MALSAGDKLGPYEILGGIGKGGMGEVYRAHDSRLNRDVAIKVSFEHFSGRFEREARAVAALNHPNICQIYDVGPNYLVMELIEGAAVKGPLPVDQALKFAAQICDALDAAHKKGITHRDLKPSNILVTKAGVKLLDFGLAKVTLGSAAADDSTITSPLTVQGEILGTLQYMSPEQVEGREADPRSDIFSFGLVLYEMLAGRRAFSASTQTGLMAAILKGEPRPLTSLQPSTPPALDRTVSKCLAKDPDDRWQSSRDLKAELEWIAQAAESAESGGATPLAGWRRALPWALFAATAAVFGVFAWVHEAGMKNAVPAEPVRLQIPLPTKPPLRLNGLFALSPDGRQLAFAAISSDGVPRIWLRALSSLAMRPLAGTEAVGTLLFWSPDSRFLAFDAGGKLQKINISGGPAETVCVLNKSAVGGSWNSDGVIIFGQWDGTVMRVSAAGGVATPLTVLDTAHGEVAHTVPSFLPDGQHFIYFRDRGTSGVISGGSLDAKPEAQDSKTLAVTADLGAIYAPSSDPNSGQLLFLRRGALMAQPFDAGRLNLSGEPVRVVEEPVGKFLDYSLYSVSTNGTLAYLSAGERDSRITWFDAQGKVLSTVGESGPYGAVAISPDGTRALVSRLALPEQQMALWLLEMVRGTSTRFGLDHPAGEIGTAVWAPDGRSVIFGSAGTGQMSDIYEKPVSGTSDAKVLIKSNEWKIPSSLSPDGRFLLYMVAGGETKTDLWVLPLDDHRKPAPLLRTAFDETDGRFSPDGHWVAYVSDESGRKEVYVRPFLLDASGEAIPEAGNKSLISTGGGYSPMWQEDGKDLYYIDLDGKLMAVSVTTRPIFQAGVPKALFQTPPKSSNAFTQDGKRFLFLVPETQGEVPFTVVLDWAAGLKK